jgi:hypothetical protein
MGKGPLMRGKHLAPTKGTVPQGLRGPTPARGQQGDIKSGRRPRYSQEQPSSVDW